MPPSDRALLPIDCLDHSGIVAAVSGSTVVF
jgi:hypothetical protein